ncbi:hypothetical protein soil367_18845 (plasmid) [Hydrocarboniclastica marina]|uniref:Uncharacterized protein n=1 Tax=Hydrocarboniclastica marina TaxID=2259620 RepID=A0A4V1D9B7_9ALTE|nr:hypothetical protein soil367_18845 [Hydrocarboniclastica marina]
MMNARLNHYLEADLVWPEACARFLIIEAKSASRRISWMASVMEMNWASFVLPISRLVTALGIETERELLRHQASLMGIISKGLEHYQDGSTRLARENGVLPCQIDDSARYSLYISGLVEGLLKAYRPSTAALKITFVAAAENSAAPQSEDISAAYDALCSEPLKQYIGGINSEQRLLCCSGRDH